MFSKAAAALILAGVALAQTFSINTPPSIQQCQPAALSWVGGTGPFILAAIPAGQVSAAALATIAENVSGTSYSWNVNLAQGTAITIKITDSTGALAYSSPLTVQAGSGSGCLSASPSGSGSGAVTASGASASSLSSVQSSISRASTTSAPATTTSAPATTSAGASTTSSASTTRSSTPATSATSAAAGFNKAVISVPVLALAAIGGFMAVGGAVALF